MSVKRDIARLGAAFDALTPHQRDKIIGGLAEFSSLIQRLRPSLESIGEDIAGSLTPEAAKPLGRALRDTGVGLLLAFARGCVTSTPEEAAHAMGIKLNDAIADLPVATSGHFRPLLAPWEA